MKCKYCNETIVEKGLFWVHVHSKHGSGYWKCKPLSFTSNRWKKKRATPWVESDKVKHILKKYNAV